MIMQKNIFPKYLLIVCKKIEFASMHTIPEARLEGIPACGEQLARLVEVRRINGKPHPPDFVDILGQFLRSVYFVALLAALNSTGKLALRYAVW
jgi:hypothetical protein